jgi:hypothetical protein
MAAPRIISIDLTHLVEAALRGEHPGEARDREEDGPVAADRDPRVPGLR